MEKKFYPDNFEQLLKETTDNFRMYPSKRVWHSIYNDLHPSRRWPSLAVWLFIIASVIYIGLSNKNQVISSDSNSNLTGTSKNTASVTLNETGKIHFTQNLKKAAELNQVQRKMLQNNFKNAISNPGNIQNNITNDIKNNQQLASLTALNKPNSNSNKPANLNNIDSYEADNDLPKTLSVASGVIAETSNEVTLLSDLKNLIKNEKESADVILIPKKTDPDPEKKLLPSDKNKNNIDKEWIEDYAFHNKPFVSKWKARVTYQFYLTPSVGYRTLSNNSKFNPVSTALVAPAGNNSQDYEEALSQSAAVNMELGGNILYNISKKWNLKAGIQLNYTNYAINAYELKHPTLTTLSINDLSNGFPVLSSRSTTLANISGASTKKLNNNTYQISIPLGADIKLAGKNNFKWFAGATIQPTFIAGGNSYLISSDLKNYVSDNSLMRTWNFNAGIETFISYKTKSGIIINAGPQFRYQILSTYSNQYNYDEKLYNLGLKIGITTRF